jgi:hypothetical protein
MEMGLFEFLSAGGYTAVNAFLIYMVWRLEKNILALSNDMKEMRENYVHKEHCEAKDLTKRISEIEKETIRREEFYREFSGWRHEIKDIDNKLSRLLFTISERSVNK